MNLPLTSLVTFLHLTETLSFARAAERAEVSPSTVSNQIASLEQEIGESLFARTRGPKPTVTLTPAGEELARLARDVLAAHTAVNDHFRPSVSAGIARLAVTDDIAASPRLGDALRGFRLRNPHVKVEITVGQSGPLYRRLRGGQFDLALIKRMPQDDCLDVLRSEEISWVMHPAARLEQRPLPLVAYPRSSFLRNHSIAALDDRGIAWRITNVVRGVNGQLAAIRSGLGIGVMASGMMPSDLEPTPSSWNLPSLGRVDTVLIRGSKATEAASRLEAGLRLIGRDLLP
ncbi:LysR family transcriptional regulator [Microbacterium oxydans]|uniref:LysR family transcriptional regulator n=1 Tax=Microbacterium oxydans TaxID=82380 RepID=UPI00226BAA05|nr:LysR family transcriptional regulator [Microbacterium oxydans]WAA65974.1 LysR family transcriptional regulator [Microbacterium oxydans]